MLVFPGGASKAFDGSTATTFTGLKGTPAGVTLNPGAIPSFDNAAIGVNKTVSFTGWTVTQTAPILPGGTAINYALATTCCGTIGQRTMATISDAPPVIPPVPPVVLPVDNEDVSAEEMAGPEGLALGPSLAIAPRLMPRVELAALPPQLLSIAPVRVPVVLPPPPRLAPAVAEEPPPVHVPPVRPRKQDRN